METAKKEKKTYYEKNRLKMLTNSKAYYWKNKEKVSTYFKKYYQINKERLRRHQNIRVKPRFRNKLDLTETKKNKNIIDYRNIEIIPENKGMIFYD